MWSKFVRDEVATDPRLVARSIENPYASEVLGLQPGELVEIKSEEEIRRTLDATGKNRGLGFMPEMWPHCGRRGRV